MTLRQKHLTTAKIDSMTSTTTQHNDEWRDEDWNDDYDK